MDEIEIKMGQVKDSLKHEKSRETNDKLSRSEHDSIDKSRKNATSSILNDLMSYNNNKNNFATNNFNN